MRASVLWQLLAVFAPLSLLAFGGGQSIVADIDHQALAHGWMTQAQFVDLFAISRAAPGPGALLATLVGWKAAGWIGAAVASLALFVPSSVLAYAMAVLWRRFDGHPAAHVIEIALAPVAAGLLLAGVGVPAAAALAGRGPGRRATELRATLSTAVVDTVHGTPDLLAYGAMDRAVARVADADAALTRVARRDAALLGLGAGISALVAGLTLWGTLLLGVAAVHGGALGPIPLAVLVLTALAAFEIVAPLPAAAARLGAVRAAGARLFGVLDVPPAVRARADEAAERAPDAAKAAFGALSAPNAAFSTGEPGIGAPLDTGLRIRDLRVRYGPGEPWALDGLDLDLSPGRRIAVVGPSGAGKSTLAEILFRFRDPDAGTVHLGGVDVTDRDPDDTRRVLSGVPQDPHVFAATLRANLLLARPSATDDDLWDVLRRVRLADDVTVLPDGLDTEVGPQGARLSGGMRQRLAVARALLADPAVLVLDEPTAHLDPDTRDAVLDDVLDATRGRTLLLVTHDLSRLDQLDEVAVVVDGRVVQRGPHAELLAVDGWYRTAHARTLPGAVAGD